MDHVTDCSSSSSLSSAAAQTHFLSQFLLDGGSIGIPQHLYSLHTQTYGISRPTNLVPVSLLDSMPHTLAAQQDKDQAFTDRNTEAAAATVRHVDSSSLSEDDVFYN